MKKEPQKLNDGRLIRPPNRCRRDELRVETVTLEDGTTFPIKLDKKEGYFFAEFTEIHRGAGFGSSGSETHSWRDGTLEGIKWKIKKWESEKRSYVWKPVIIFTMWGDPGANAVTVFEVNAERAFRAEAKTKTGFIYRHWSYKKPVADNATVEIGDLSDGYPPGSIMDDPATYGRDQWEHFKLTILEYTPERWAAILELDKMEKELRKKLQKVIGGGAKSIDGMLKKVSTQGLLGITDKA